MAVTSHYRVTFFVIDAEFRFIIKPGISAFLKNYPKLNVANRKFGLSRVSNYILKL